MNEQMRKDYGLVFDLDALKGCLTSRATLEFRKEFVKRGFELFNFGDCAYFIRENDVEEAREIARSIYLSN